jgi:hypothetical protein
MLIYQMVQYMVNETYWNMVHYVGAHYNVPLLVLSKFEFRYSCAHLSLYSA